MSLTAPRTGVLSRRLRWWTELPLIAVVYGVYSVGRLLARGDVSTAVDHGLGILHLEKLLRINAESPLNRLFTEHPSVGIPADFAYAALHYLVTPAVLIWLWKRRPAHYRVMRGWLMISTFIGLIGFILLPTCPPRLLAAGYGFVDTMAQYGSYGWWGGEASAPRGMGGLTNQYAAMPSLHVGWALWCGVVLWQLGKSRLTKSVAVAYPLLITVVVMGTANHYFLDAVAGAAVMGIGLLLVRPTLRLAGRALGRLGALLPEPWRERLAGRLPGAEAGPGGAEAEPAAVAAVAASTPGTSGAAMNVSAECETSAGERIPRQPNHGRGPGADAGATGTDVGAAADEAATATR
ncbi:phosphatase PAP2 family protein [Streptomyces sp. H27-D2]|uniref:phosphatase PAP2 family protein n=1 Tax=Streptomyces sp. H27-D2 TaxID=3046304 RepID=UPI002DB83928|nr:phosphatase PAP2 family protein [Streptomyces sp. H27-D2]MEC4015213.1 phosphatase PAP2 family protein [Streptomyces sp. H27-D2]